jgi:hypothetical protein
MVPVFFAFIGAAVTQFLLPDDEHAGRTFLAVAAGLVVGVTAAVCATRWIAGVWDIGLMPLGGAIMGPMAVWRISRQGRPKALPKNDLRNLPGSRIRR